MAKIIKTMIDPNDAVMLLIDHQSGLFQLVADMDMPTLRNNSRSCACTSAYLRLLYWCVYVCVCCSCDLSRATFLSRVISSLSPRRIYQSKHAHSRQRGQ